MGEDAVPQIAGADYPPVVNNSSRQAHVPERTVFACKQDGDQPECGLAEGSEGHSFEVTGIDDPSHQPAPPEQFFKNGHGDNTGGDAEKQKQRVALRCGWCDPRRMTHYWIVEKDG